MTFAENELFSETSVGALKRAIATSIQPKVFAADAEAPTLDLLTPVAFNTDVEKWQVWTADGDYGTGTIKGFVWPDDENAAQPPTLDASDDVLINVLMSGKIHYDDIALPSGESEADLIAALNAGVRDLGISIEGLPSFH